MATSRHQRGSICNDPAEFPQIEVKNERVCCKNYPYAGIEMKALGRDDNEWLKLVVAFDHHPSSIS
jgi:hypothetical protein